MKIIKIAILAVFTLTSVNAFAKKWDATPGKPLSETVKAGADELNKLIQKATNDFSDLGENGPLFSKYYFSDRNVCREMENYDEVKKAFDDSPIQPGTELSFNHNYAKPLRMDRVGDKVYLNDYQLSLRNDSLHQIGDDLDRGIEVYIEAPDSGNFFPDILSGKFTVTSNHSESGLYLVTEKGTQLKVNCFKIISRHPEKFNKYCTQKNLREATIAISNSIQLLGINLPTQLELSTDEPRKEYCVPTAHQEMHNQTQDSDDVDYAGEIFQPSAT